MCNRIKKSAKQVRCAQTVYWDWINSNMKKREFVVYTLFVEMLYKELFRRVNAFVWLQNTYYAATIRHICVIFSNDVIVPLDRDPLTLVNQPVISCNATDDVFSLIMKYVLTRASMSTSAPSSLS